jgi:hypothetical protein
MVDDEKSSFEDGEFSSRMHLTDIDIDIDEVNCEIATHSRSFALSRFTHRYVKGR